MERERSGQTRAPCFARQLISFFSGRKRDIPAITRRHPHSADAVNGARGGSNVLPGRTTQPSLLQPLCAIIALLYRVELKHNVNVRRTNDSKTMMLGLFGDRLNRTTFG